jgi:hypothetical protein
MLSPVSYLWISPYFEAGAPINFSGSKALLLACRSNSSTEPLLDVADHHTTR